MIHVRLIVTSPGRKLTFNSLRKATPSPNKFTNMPESPTKRQLLPPTNSPKCNSISKQLKQHARSSSQKGALSPNKITIVQENVDELDGCHEGRYNIEITKLKTLTIYIYICTLKVCSTFFRNARNIKKRKCPFDETPCSPLKVVKCTMQNSTKKHQQLKKKKRGVYVPAFVKAIQLFCSYVLLC